jgi:short-subunit dehydrogenase
MVTGASSGIGRALAMELARRGYRVGLIARRKDALEELARQIAAQGGTALAAAADVGDRQAVHAAVRELESALGPTEVMVANAGLGVPTHHDPINIADVEATFRVNLLGVVYSIEAVLPGLLARGRGQLVAISSLAAFKGVPGESAYCASKAAVNVFMEGLRIALRSKGIAVLTVCPGFVDTPILPMDTPTPFKISAESAARRIARRIVGRKSGLVSFPWPMAALTAIMRRFPDFLVARILGLK